MFRLVLLFVFLFVPAKATAKSTVLVRDVISYAGTLGFYDPTLVAAVAAVESSFDEHAMAISKGIPSYGLMQIQLGTARFVGFKGHPRDLLRWRVNVRAAVRYLDHLLKEYDYNVEAALAAYNAGKARRRRGRYINQGYVDKVIKQYRLLKGCQSIEVVSR